MSLPSNVHVSNHPCLRAKLSQLRSGNTSAKEVKTLVHEISLLVGTEALATAVSTAPGPKVRVGACTRGFGWRKEQRGECMMVWLCHI